MTSTPEQPDTTPAATDPESVPVQPMRDQDTSVESDPGLDPAQAEWDRTTALDEGPAPSEQAATTGPGAAPPEIPDQLDEVPAADLAPESLQPETQGHDPVAAELGEDGQGDLAPEDL